MNKQERPLEPTLVEYTKYIYHFVFNLYTEAQPEDEMELAEELEIVLEDMDDVDIDFDSFEITVKYKSDSANDFEKLLVDTIKSYGVEIKDWKVYHKEEEWSWYGGAILF